MATKVRRVDVATYRSDRGEMLTEADMQGIFGDDITGLEGEDRDDVTLLMPFAGISFLWFIGAVRDGLGALRGPVLLDRLPGQRGCFYSR